MEARNAHHVQVFLAIARVRREQDRAPVLEFDQQAVVTCGVARRLEQPQAFGDLLIPGHRFELRRVHIEQRIGRQF